MGGLRSIISKLILATTAAASAASAQSVSLPPAHKVIPYIAGARTTLDVTNHDTRDLEMTLCYAPSYIQPPTGIPQTPSCSRLALKAGASWQLEDVVKNRFNVTSGVGVLTISNASGTATVPTDPIAVPPGVLFKTSINLNATGGDWAAAQFDLDIPAGITYSSMTAGSAATAAGKTIAVNGALPGGDARAIIYGINQNAMGSGELAVASLRIGSNTTPGPLPLSTKNVTVATKDGLRAPADMREVFTRISSVEVLPLGSKWVINGDDLGKLEARTTTYQRQTDTASPFYAIAQGTSHNMLSPAELLSPGAPRTILGPYDTAMYTQNIGLFATDEQVSIKTTLKSRTGATLATKSTTIPPYQHLLQPMFTFFGVTPQANTAIEVEVEYGKGASAYGQLIDTKSSASMILLPQGSAGAAYAPKVATTATSTADLAFRASGGGATNSVPLDFFKLGTTVPVTVPNALALNEVRAARNIVGTGGFQQPAGTVGSLRASSATATPHIVSISRDAYSGTTTMGASFQGLTAADAAIGAGSAAESSVAHSINGLPAARTSIGVLNVSGAPLTGRLIAYDSNGAQLATYPVAARANEPKLYNNLMAALPGTVRVRFEIDGDTAGTTHRALVYAVVTDPKGPVQYVRTGHKLQ